MKKFGPGTCVICGCAPNNPFRVRNPNGEITAGCIAPAHSGELEPGSDSHAWHERPSARQHRDEVRANELLTFGVECHYVRLDAVAA